jgi:hypothetical protein
MLVLSGAARVHRVVKPRSPADDGLVGAQEVEGIEKMRQVSGVVIATVRLRPAGQKVFSQCGGVGR